MTSYPKLLKLISYFQTTCIHKIHIHTYLNTPTAAWKSVLYSILPTPASTSTTCMRAIASPISTSITAHWYKSAQKQHLHRAAPPAYSCTTFCKNQLLLYACASPLHPHFTKLALLSVGETEYVACSPNNVAGSISTLFDTYRHIPSFFTTTFHLFALLDKHWFFLEYYPIQLLYTISNLHIIEYALGWSHLMVMMRNQSDVTRNKTSARPTCATLKSTHGAYPLLFHIHTTFSDSPLSRRAAANQQLAQYRSSIQR